MTERLTVKDEKGTAFLKESDMKDPCEFCYEATQKLAHYEDLEEQGKLIELPCAVSDTVWFYNEALEEVCEGKVIGFVLNIYTTPRLWIEVEYTSRLIGEQTFKDREDFMLGKKIFLTREEAEAALKGAKE